MICCYLIVSWFVGWGKALLLLSEHYALDTGFAMPWQEGLPSPHKKGCSGGFLSAHEFSGNLIIRLLAEESLLEKKCKPILT
jgi:hypothetical protein